MLIRRPSKSAKPRGSRPAFTLIELLVVVAIIAILMSILLPSLRAAREQARAAVCGQRLGDLGRGMQMYFTEQKDWIPGVNTSGLQIRVLEGSSNWWNQPRIPVQTWDWVTPIMNNTLTMPSNRAKRFRDIIDNFRCPSQKFYRAVVWGDGPKPPDKADFDNEPAGWTPLSYLMPVNFQYWGSDYAQGGPSELVIGVHPDNPRNKFYPRTAPPDHSWEADHRTYKSKINDVGNTGQKIMAADGTRYLDVDQLDFDAAPNPSLYGSFTTSGGWWSGETSYGVRRGTQNYNGRTVSAEPKGAGRNLELSYRHGPIRGAAGGSAQQNKGQINAAFFDGSVRRLTDRQSRNPVLWYPKGTTVNDTSEVMVDDLKNGDLVP